MALGDLTSAAAVEQAMDEYDRRGRRVFLAEYGYSDARWWYVFRRGRRYESKAIAGRAYSVQYHAAALLPPERIPSRSVHRWCNPRGPLMSAQIPVIGKRFLFDFGENAKYELDFKDAHSVIVTVVADPAYPAGTVNHFEIARTEIRPDVYMVTWVEPETGNTVVHVQDFVHELAYTNITDLTSRGFWNLTGQITPIGDSAGGYLGVDLALNEDAAREAGETPGMG